MIYKCVLSLSLVCFVVIMTGCSALLLEQEWSENYALLDGSQSTIPQMIDGDISTVGKTKSTNGAVSPTGQTALPEVVITLPEKKVIRKVIIRSDNIKKFNLYADKGGSPISGTDWQLIRKVQSAKAGKIVIPVFDSFPTDSIRLVVLGTKDDASFTRDEVDLAAQICSTSSGSS